MASSAENEEKNPDPKSYSPTQKLAVCVALQLFQHREEITTETIQGMVSELELDQDAQEALQAWGSSGSSSIRVLQPFFRSADDKHILFQEVAAAAVLDGNYCAADREIVRKFAIDFEYEWDEVYQIEKTQFKRLSEFLREAELPVSDHSFKLSPVMKAALTGGSVIALFALRRHPLILGASLAMKPLLYWRRFEVLKTSLEYGKSILGINQEKQDANYSENFSERLLPVGGEGWHTTICVHGFLTEASKAIKHWENLPEVFPHAQHYALLWDSSELKQLRESMLSASNIGTLPKLAQTLAKKPTNTAALKSIGGILFDSAERGLHHWYQARRNAIQLGHDLADYLRKSEASPYPISLIGFSLGTEVVLTALEQLAETEHLDRIHHVVFLGGAVAFDEKRFSKAQTAINGRWINCHTKNDLILWSLYRIAQNQRYVAGLQEIELAGIENIDVSDLVSGHLKYETNTEEIFKLIKNKPF